MNLKKEAAKEEKLKEKARAISIKEGSAYSIMDGFGLRYITPYAVSLGASNSTIGLLSSLPGFLGTLSQLFTWKAMEKNSRKKLIIKSIFIQALMWLPLIAIGIFYFYFGLSTFKASVFLLIIYSLMTIFGAFVGPIWSSWMRDIVPKHSGDYFGKRVAITGLVALITMLFAGLILDSFKKHELIIIGFSIIFLVAFAGRIISLFYLKKEYEPKYISEKKSYFSFIDFIKKMPKTNFGKFVLILAVISFSVAIASPYFSVMMLKTYSYENNYLFYTLVILSSSLSGLITTRPWGRIIDKYGNVQVLKINAFLISFVPIIWAISYFIFIKVESFLLIYLIIIEIFTGIIWAGFNLASSVFVFEAVSREKMALCVTYNGLINAFFALTGALVGGVLSTYSLFEIEPLLIVLIVSGILRMGSAFIFYYSVKEIRPVESLGANAIEEEIFRYINPRHLLDVGIRRRGYNLGHI